MKKLIFTFFMLAICVKASATIDVDSLLMAQTINNINEESTELFDAPLLDASMMPEGELKTYTNWLGETCIAEQEGNTKAHPYYTWKRDVTYVGIPIFLSAFIIKGQKKAFRSTRFAFEKNFKTEIDNYTQFLPYAALVGMKAFGYEGRSSWDRMLVSTLASNAVMALAVNATKYSVKEMRPDNSSANSFPSGHTATSFVAATVFHKEYGLTRSPWYSVAGYGVATATGVMRVLNNRHWISDVIAGAGIGIMSTELGYWIGDLIYKDKGICRYELNNFTDPNHPSFFDIQMGVAAHSSTIAFQYADDVEAGFMYPNETIHLGTSSVVGVEGAYFFNKYFGIGGMARVTTTPAKNTALDTEEKSVINDINDILESYEYPGIYQVKVENNNFMDVSLDAGIYGNLPLSKRFSIGAKFLVGARISGGISYQAQNGFKKPFRDADGNPVYTYTGIGSTPVPMYVFQQSDGTEFAANEVTMPGVSTQYNYALDETHKWEGSDIAISKEYDISKVDGNNSFNYVFGISLTYRYKNNYSWKIFADYDGTKNHYDLNIHYVSDELRKYIFERNPELNQEFPYTENMVDEHYTADKRFNLWTIGGAFSVNF